MRSLAITFLFSAMSFCCLAQSAFTEQTLLDMNKRMMQDFSKFMSEEVSPEYTFTTEDGALIPYQTMKDFKIKVLEWNTHDLKIKQIGNAVIVRGINKNTIQSATSGTIRNYNLQFIYTYEYKNGKWLWFSSHHIYNNPSKAEEVAIKKALEDETVAFSTGNKEGMKKMWKDDATNFFMGSYNDGGLYNLDNETMKKYIAENLRANGNTAVKTNHRFKFAGNLAIVDYDQVTTTPKGGKLLQRNVNILEKIGDEWKFVGASHHGYNDNKQADNPEEIVKQWTADYNKDGKSFFENNCSDDYIASNTGINGGKFFGREAIIGRARKENETNDAETTNMKSFKSGNLAVVVSNVIRHHKQADGSDKPDKTVSTWILQKKDGKWWYAGHHISPLKE